ncbi:MAG TPA: 2Fe-2S iron-sulfur cluster-binding protein [Blastocatellia bacterium]|nr:2Fe-2S iron-sulfur cluster-binding protein [Blastocatellia bacterium]
MSVSAVIPDVAPETTDEAGQQLHPDLNLELFDPFERLVQIEVLGQKYSVPEKNSLLRCFQYVAFEPISYGGFCWNGTCRTCEVRYHLGDERDRQCLTCCTKVTEGMVITETSPEIRFE